MLSRPPQRNREAARVERPWSGRPWSARQHRRCRLWVAVRGARLL